MANELGKVVTVYVDGAGGTALPLPGQTTASVLYNTSVADNTNKGSDFETHLSAKVGYEISFEGFYDHADSAISRVLSVVEAGPAIVNGEIRRTATTYKSFSGTLTSFSVDHTDAEAATYSGTIQVSGALT